MSKFEHLSSPETDGSDSIEQAAQEEPVLDELGSVPGETARELGSVACDGSPSWLCKQCREETPNNGRNNQMAPQVVAVGTIAKKTPYKREFINPADNQIVPGTQEQVAICFQGSEFSLEHISFEVPVDLYWRLREYDSSERMNDAYTRIEAIHELMEHLYDYENSLTEEDLMRLKQELSDLHVEIVREELRLLDLQEFRHATDGDRWVINSSVVG